MRDLHLSLELKVRLFVGERAHLDPATGKMDRVTISNCTGQGREGPAPEPRYLGIGLKGKTFAASGP